MWDKNLRVWGFVVCWFRVGTHAWPAKFKRGMCEMEILESEILAHMRSVTWRAVPAQFNTGMCEMKILGSESEVLCWHTCVVSSGPSCSGKVRNRDVWDEHVRIEVCSVSWDVGSGWVGSHAWCNMESCSGKVQNRSWVGWKGCAWPFSGEVLILQFKGLFWTYAEHCCFHLLCHFYFQFSTYPRHTEFNLLYLDFSFSEIGVGSAFHRFAFFWLIPWPSRFLN